MGKWFWQRADHFIGGVETDDLPVLAEIHEAGFPHGWDADTLASMLGSSGMSGWVARNRGGGRPLGFVLVRNTGEEAEIITIAVAGRARRRGVGNALMRHVVLELRRERVERLFLEVSENNSAALALYRSLGFRRIGERKGYYVSHVAPSGGGKPPSALVMELVLR